MPVFSELAWHERMTVFAMRSRLLVAMLSNTPTAAACCGPHTSRTSNLLLLSSSFREATEMARHTCFNDARSRALARLATAVTLQRAKCRGRAGESQNATIASASLDQNVHRMAGATEASASGWKVADKSWERVQVKTFTNWVNSHLRWREMKVADLSQDFHDGVILSELLEQISGKVVPHKKEVKATDRHKKIDNLQNAVKFVAEFYKEAGVKITTSAEDLVDCKSGAILGMVWVIIHKFAVSGINEGSASAKEGLLLWAQRNTAGYAGVKVENFSTSWKDGLAFCALIHNLDHSLLDFASLKADEPAKNLELAFSIAEKVFDIPRLFDPEDVCDLPRPDEKSIMTYLAAWWQKFSGMSRKIFNNHIVQKAVQEAMALSNMRASYIEQANSFEVFASKWAKLLSESSNASSFRELQAAFMQYDDFETSDFLSYDALLMQVRFSVLIFCIAFSPVFFPYVFLQIEVLGSSISRKLQAGNKVGFRSFFFGLLNFVRLHCLSV